MDLDFLRQARNRFLQTSTVFLGLPGGPGPAVPSGCPAGQPDSSGPQLPAWPFAQHSLPTVA
ncbi:hypothetical protein LMG23992_02819 [Cupriavidus laharis]|uniref:Uncharacterized protein n=1 Tax=Cupriavidus laharis TaxID=151654 RepID=A0ABM8X4U1_9BURK|nr:hypothetical protein [Cupriavidus laharis]CAG9174921.1 hypothetical protein LMG23992_02819 [Cupriavidus laharis]